jgi:hypothetical protein
MRLPHIRSRDSTIAGDGPTTEIAGAGSSSIVVDTAAPTTDTTIAPSNGPQQPVAAAAAAVEGRSTPSMIGAGQRQTAVTPAEVVSTTTIPEVEKDQHDVDLEAQEVEQEGDDLVSRLGEADTTIAQAWLAKRREQIQGGNGKSTAVDVDTLSRWFNNPANNNNNNNVYPQSADYLSTRRVHGGQRISPYHHENDAESSLSSWSIRTDKTPVVSNRVPGAIPRLSRPLPRLAGVGEGGGEGPVLPLLPQASSPTPDPAVQDPQHPHPTTPVPLPRARGQDLSCRDVFDYTKWHGKVRCCLVAWMVSWLVLLVGSLDGWNCVQRTAAAGS